MMFKPWVEGLSKLATFMRCLTNCDIFGDE